MSGIGKCIKRQINWAISEAAHYSACFDVNSNNQPVVGVRDVRQTASHLLQIFAQNMISKPDRVKHYHLKAALGFLAIASHIVSSKTIKSAIGGYGCHA